MASNQQNSTSSHNTHFDEHRWVIHIRNTLQEEEDEIGRPVSVFNVPKALQLSKPEAYMPQFISIGPYHHQRPELLEMERYKLASAKRTQKLLHGITLNQLVEKFVGLQKKIRAYYHRYLDFNGETLAWLMIVDASFLLEFLRIHTADAEVNPFTTLPRTLNWVDFAGRESAHNLILRDSMILENQIPLFLLKKILEPQCTSPEEADNFLNVMLTAYMKELCPFKMMENFPTIESTEEHSHLLELLYFILVPKSKDPVPPTEDITTQDHEPHEDHMPSQPTQGNYDEVKQVFPTIWNSLPSLQDRSTKFIKQVASSRPVKFLTGVPWKMLTRLPGLSVLKNPLQILCASLSKVPKDDNPSPDTDTNTNKPPLVEEIMIPSVEQLIDIGVKFLRTNGDINTISFDVKTATFYLPTVCLDVYTEVIMRNLVAYEAASVSGPLVLARYTELMNGIIDTEEDVELLRKQGIIMNHMKSDQEAANLWNCMNKSIRLTKVPSLDKAIEDVNKHYNSKLRVKTKKFMKKYVFGSWQVLTFLATVLLLLLTALQAVCSVYTCSRWFGFVATVTPQQ